MNEFQEQLLDHYKNPRNFGKPDWTGDRTASEENISCGDEITFYLKISNKIIEDISFTGRGCSISIGTASLLSEFFKGNKVELIKKFSEDEIKDLIGFELTSSRLNCSTLPLRVLKKAIASI